MTNVHGHWVGICFAFAVAACAPGAQEADVGFSQPAPAEESILVVQNDNWTAVDIYAVMGSTRSRLGSVPADQTAKLRLGRVLLARPELQLQADPIGPENPFTFPAISIRPGTRVEMMVANSLRMSGFTCVVAC